MSSNIRVQRVCQHCGNDFTARTSVTQYCSDTCSKRAYKARVRTLKVEASNTETLRIKTMPIEELKAKEFLTVKNIATLLNCSIRSVYYNIENGKIKAVNLGERIIRVKRSDIDKLFDQSKDYGNQS
jgi:excisionase family DNA binding protein